MGTTKFELIISGVEIGATAARNREAFSKKKGFEYWGSRLDTPLPLKMPATPRRILVTHALLLRNMTSQTMVADLLGMPDCSGAELEKAFIARGMDTGIVQIESILTHATEEYNPNGLLFSAGANLFFAAVNGRLVVLDARWISYSARWDVFAVRFGSRDEWFMKDRVLVGNPVP